MENNLLEILNEIDPSLLTYSEWCQCGMALKEEGYTAADWDSWSQQDAGRYNSGECWKKWDSFQGQGTGAPVTGGTIVQYAKDQGWKPAFTFESGGHELDWGDSIDKDDLVVVDKNWLEKKEVYEPRNWNPVRELVRYLDAIFEPSEIVAYNMQSWLDENDNKWKPGNKGAFGRSAGELIQQLNQYNDIGSALGDYTAEAGAWIRFNPFDGKGVKNDNVTEFKYALVESDNMDISEQNAIIHELELPVAALVHSGGKSIHAIVKIDAANYEEYRKRVDYLYEVCKKNGLNIDRQNRNPSRLSRMPGVTRNGKKQFLIGTNIGKGNWAEWHEWIEGINDDLPDPESLDQYWDNLPELAPVLIDGVLRQGHKLLMAGPSKAGKSFALIELSIAIAEGRQWIGWNCTQGKILYVNLELDRPSALHRFKDVYEGLGWQPNNLHNIDIWNLRGKTVPMDKLAPKLIRRAAKKDYIAVIIDPIYKVLTGDENSADQMAHFTNQFDKVATELGCAVIYCHHHSKGSQGGKKSMDRASGSGVFARDPDALIDLVELELSEDLQKAQKGKAACTAYEEAFRKYNPDYMDENISDDDYMSEFQMSEHAKVGIPSKYKADVTKAVNDAKQLANTKSAWRIEGTLREFPKFDAVNMWFEYPRHTIDTTGILADIQPGDEQPAWKKNLGKKKDPKDKKKERIEAVKTAFDACTINGDVTTKDMAEYMGVTEKTVRNRIKEHGGFWIDEGVIGLKSDNQTQGK